jgi:CarboxypepD_reg-like domain
MIHYFCSVKRHLIVILFSITAFNLKSTAQQDTVVQLYGVVMTADSLMALPRVSVMVKGQNRGTITNDKGIFSIVVYKGDMVEFSCIGYKNRETVIPLNVEGNQQSIIQLMVSDTFFHPVAIIRPRPTPEQFARDFINLEVNDDDVETARKNNDDAKKRVLLETLPSDGREAVSASLASNARKYYYTGQAPPQNLFNPIAWGKFIKAWKRGDFKRKKK